MQIANCCYEWKSLEIRFSSHERIDSLLMRAWVSIASEGAAIGMLLLQLLTRGPFTFVFRRRLWFITLYGVCALRYNELEK